MKKAEATDALRPEYSRADFGRMARGKHAAALARGSNVVVLDPEVAQVFPTAEAVNDALRGLIESERLASAAPRHRRRKVAAAK